MPKARSRISTSPPSPFAAKPPPQKPGRAKRNAAIAGAVALLLAAPLASSGVRNKLGGAWRGFQDPQGVAPAEASTSPSVEEGEAPLSEQPDFEGDFSLADLDAPEAYGMEGVVPSLSDLPIPITQRTLRYVEYFGSDADGRDAFFVRMRRAGKYRSFIEDSMRIAGLPEDIVWLAAIESGFIPQATSPKGAVGLFQFMPETAERFGLSMTEEIDERRSITRSTEAAIAYLSFLKEKFGSWDLAIAGYNCGEGNLDEALEKARKKLGREPEAAVAFHELAALHVIPKETADFVPKIHAFAIIAHNAEVLALDDLDPVAPLRFAQIAVPSRTRLSTIAAAADVSIASLRELNPDLLVDHVPTVKGDVLINVSPDDLAQVLAALPAHIARAEPIEDKAGKSEEKSDAKKPSNAKSVASTKGTKSSKTSTSTTEEGHGGSTSSKVASKDGTSKAGPEKVTLRPAPMRPGAYALSNGLIVEIKKEESATVSLSAKVDVKNPLKNRSSLNQSFSLEEKKVAPGDLKTALDDVKKELRNLELGAPSSKLREKLAADRKLMHDKAFSTGPFVALSERVFPKGHPMHGALLVGPTEVADDMFLEPEPTWALETVITLKGPVDADALGADLESAFDDTFVPTKAPPLASAGRVTVGNGERRVLIGWSAPPLRASNQTAAHVAFILACHNRMGRFHRALRLDKQMTGRLNCSLELAPSAAVAWVFAMPSMPHTIADVEKEVDTAVTSLSTEGPTDAEMTAARGLLRAELARERESATIRGMPKSYITARNEQILAGLDTLTKKDVIDAAKSLFAKDRRVVVVSD